VATVTSPTARHAPEILPPAFCRAKSPSAIFRAPDLTESIQSLPSVGLAGSPIVIRTFM